MHYILHTIAHQIFEKNCFFSLIPTKKKKEHNTWVYLYDRTIGSLDDDAQVGGENRECIPRS